MHITRQLRSRSPADTSVGWCTPEPVFHCWKAQEKHSDDVFSSICHSLRMAWFAWHSLTASPDPTSRLEPLPILQHPMKWGRRQEPWQPSFPSGFDFCNVPFTRTASNFTSCVWNIGEEFHIAIKQSFTSVCPHLLENNVIISFTEEWRSEEKYHSCP